MSDLFVQRNDGALVSYSGMDQATVVFLLSQMGFTGTFLTLQQYQADIAVLPKPIVPVPVDLGPLETALNATPTTDAKLTALIALLQAKGIV